MAFYAQDSGRLIVNYSNEHYKNGQQKNGSADGNYKETIRILKNARNKMRRDNSISKGTAPSYFIEGLLYNISNSHFEEGDLRDRYDEIVSELEAASVGEFDEQSEMYSLCDGTDPDRWNTTDAQTFIDGLRQLWDNW